MPLKWQQASGLCIPTSPITLGDSEGGTAQRNLRPLGKDHRTCTCRFLILFVLIISNNVLSNRIFQPFTHILWGKTFSHTPYGVTKFAGITFSSDLRKLTAVSKSLSNFKMKYSVTEKII